MLINIKRLAVMCMALMPASAVLAEQKQLIYAADLIRHGARTSLSEPPDKHYPMKWQKSNIGFAQLTPYGFDQEAQNGIYFRAFYQSLIPTTSSPQQVMHIISDGCNRDLMSAEGVLSGWQLGQYQLPIIAIPTQTDSLLAPKHKSYAPITPLQGWQHLWHSPIGYPLAKELKQKHLVGKICPYETSASNYRDCLLPAKALGVDAESLNDYCSHAQSHCDTHSILHLSQSLLNQVIDAYHQYKFYSFIYTHKPGFKNSRQNYLRTCLSAGGGLFAHVLIQHLQQAVQHQSNIRYRLYAAHDTTLLAVLGYLASQDPNSRIGDQLIGTGNPNFAADLSFRLYKVGKNNNKLIVVYRNGSGPKVKEQMIYQGSLERFVQLYDRADQVESYPQV